MNQGQENQGCGTSNDLGIFLQPASQCSEVQEFSTSANQTFSAPLAPTQDSPLPNTPSKMYLHAHSTLPWPFLWLHWIRADCNLPAFMENNFSCSFYHPEMKYLGISLVAEWIRIRMPVQGPWFWSLGQEDPLEEEMATHSRILAWEIPWTEEPGGLHSMRLQRVKQNLATNSKCYPCFTQ